MTEPERLAVVETELRTTKETAGRIENKLDRLADSILHNYMPRTEVDALVNAIKSDIRNMKNQKWFIVIVTNLTTIIMTGLVTYFLATAVH